MMFYLLSPVIAVVIMVIQLAVLDLFSGGAIAVELALIAVVYAAFNFDVVKGAVFAAMLGFLHDAMGGLITGLFMCSYLSVFFVSTILSDRVYPENSSFIAGYLAICTFVHGTIIFCVYRFVGGVDIPYLFFPKVFLPQALVAGAVAPVLFSLFRRFEGVLNGKDA